MGNPHATVIIPTRNRATYLDLTLASYVAERSAARFEVVVVDDGGEDETPAVVEKYVGRLSLTFERCVHRGRSAARNVALRLAKGGVIIFSDDDRLAGAGFIDAHLAAHGNASRPRVVLGKQTAVVTLAKPAAESRMADIWATALDSELRRGICSGRELMFTPEELLAEPEIVEKFAIPEPYWRDCLQVVLDRYGESMTGFQLPWTIGATGNMSVTRAAIDQAGHFEEGFVGWGLEDADLHYRLHTNGADTVFHLAAENFHQCHERPARLKREWTRNLVRFFEKYRNLDIAAYVCAAHNVDVGYRCFAQMSDVLTELSEQRKGAPKMAAEVERLLMAHASLLLRAAVVY